MNANNMDTLKPIVTVFQNASNVQETINLQIVQEKPGQMMWNVSFVEEVIQQITNAVVFTNPCLRLNFLHFKIPKVFQSIQIKRNPV